MANTDTGKVYKVSKDGLSFQKIPSVTPGADITSNYKSSNGKVILCNNITFYIFDLENNTYTFHSYKKSADFNYSSIYFYEDSLGYIEYSENKAVFYRMNL